MSRWLILIFLLPASAYAESRVGGDIAPNGNEIALDLPRMCRVKNRGGSDGKGLCVFASAKHSAVWAHVEPLEEIFEYMWTRPGGGWPDKLKQTILDICREKGEPPPRFINYEGRELSVLRVAIDNGHMPGITYYRSASGRYSGQRISHMVSLVHLDDQWAGILDNNFPGEIEWVDVRTFHEVWTGGQGNGWAFILISPGPPPPPKNP